MNFTTSQNLIYNNWGITFSNPEPKRNGEYLAQQQLMKLRDRNRNIPMDVGEPSRQVLRALNRKLIKRHRSGHV